MVLLVIILTAFSLKSKGYKSLEIQNNMRILKMCISKVSKEINYSVEIFICHRTVLQCGGIKLFV